MAMKLKDSLKRFEKHDWYGYCDAQRFADGSDPFLGEILIDGNNWEVVVDGSGMGFMGPADKEETHLIYVMDEVKSWQCFCALQELESVTLTQLVEWGAMEC